MTVAIWNSKVQAGVDLVGNDDHAVPLAHRADPRERLAVPDPTDGVVGVAEQEEIRVRIGQLLVQILPVDGIVVPVIDQPVFRDLASVLCDDIQERVVGRGHQQDVLAGGGQPPDQGGNGSHDAARKQKPVLLDGQTVAVFPPVDIALIPVVGELGIAEDAVVQTGAEGVQDFRRRLKVHVRHPHRQLVFLDVPFEGIGPQAGGRMVKIVVVFHVWNLPFCICRVVDRIVVKDILAQSRPGNKPFRAFSRGQTENQRAGAESGALIFLRRLRPPASERRRE